MNNSTASAAGARKVPAAGAGMELMKQFDWRSGILGAVAGVGMVLLIGAAERNPDDGRYQLSDNWTDANGVHGVYRLDTRTGELMEVVGSKGTSIPQTEIHPR